MMKYTLFLLAAMVGPVCGLELLGASIVYKGESIDDESPCSDVELEHIYDMCVVNEAAGLDLNLSRRLELRGSRELQSYCAGCPADKEYYGRGHWCWTSCRGRRGLQVPEVPDELVHTESFLSAQGKIKDAAWNCIAQNIIDTNENFTCLGDAAEVFTQIFLSE
jgi:hypothetical protein